MKQITANEGIILTNAQYLFAKYGLANVTLQDIANGYKNEGKDNIPFGVSVSLGSLRTLFTRKEDIIRRIFDIWWDRVLGRLETILNEVTKPSNKLRRILTDIPRLLEENLDSVGVLIRERYPVATNGDESECPKALRCLKLMADLILQIANDNELLLPSSNTKTIVHSFYGAIEQGLLDIYINYRKPAQNNTLPKVVEAEKIIAANKQVSALIETLQYMANGILKNAEFMA